MTGNAFFVDRCPYCQRSNRVFVGYLGLPVKCRHCQQEFTARDRHSDSLCLDQPITVWNSASSVDDEKAGETFNRPR